MATLKPISTISYNSPSFLEEKLNIWYNAHIIQAYMFIIHQGEDGDKPHIHLRVEPNKKLDPMDLTEQLKEFDGSNPKPKGVRPWRQSKEEDWVLYAVHDSTYLKLKYGGGEKGEKLPYLLSDLKASPDYDIETTFIRAKAYLSHTTVNMATQLQDGKSPLSLILEGENPYTVNAIVKALQSNDYTRLAKEYQYNVELLSKITVAVHNAGFNIEQNEDGTLFLSPF